jgi:hypothetical protein
MLPLPARFLWIGILVNKCLGDEPYAIVRGQRQDFGRCPPVAEHHVRFIQGDAAQPSRKL